MRGVVKEEVQVDTSEVSGGAGEPQGAGRLNKDEKDEKRDNITIPKKLLHASPTKPDPHNTSLPSSSKSRQC